MVEALLLFFERRVLMTKLEKTFPPVTDEVFEGRLARLTKELEKQGYRESGIEYDMNFISFEKRNKNGGITDRHIISLWHLRHEPDEDFERIIERIKREGENGNDVTQE